MGYILDRVKTAIRAAADAEDKYSQIGYGDPSGEKVSIEGLGWFYRGMAWLEDRTNSEQKGLMDYLLNNLCGELERSPTQFCTVDVAALQAPAVLKQTDGVTSVVKHETGIPIPTNCDYITVNLENAYVDAYYTIHSYVYDYGLIPLISNVQADSFRLEFIDHTGFSVNLTDKLIGIMTKGKLS